VSAAQIAKKMLALGACKEGRDWIEKTNQADFQRGWKVCPAPEFMCWLGTRLLGAAGVRASLACTKLATTPAKDKLLDEIVLGCEQVLDGKSKDTKKLQVLAYDATERALERKLAHGSAFLAASYAAYAVHFLTTSSLDTDAALKLKHLLKAAQHSSDATSHAKHGLPQNTNLTSVVRKIVADDAIYKAWLSAPNPG
jgi:hypothetical protein